MIDEGWLRERLDRAADALIYKINEEVANAHIGPIHHPIDSDIYTARRNLSRWERNDRWKRSAGTYRR